MGGGVTPYTKGDELSLFHATIKLGTQIDVNGKEITGDGGRMTVVIRPEFRQKFKKSQKRYEPDYYLMATEHGKTREIPVKVGKDYKQFLRVIPGLPERIPDKYYPKRLHPGQDLPPQKRPATGACMRPLSLFVSLISLADIGGVNER
jgi:hypothetical protein